jgi:hypothetical protein
MLPTVQLDHQLSLAAVEVDYVAVHWMLVAELEASELFPSEEAPEKQLRVGHVLAEISGEGKKPRWDWGWVEHSLCHVAPPAKG